MSFSRKTKDKEEKKSPPVRSTNNRISTISIRARLSSLLQVRLTSLFGNTTNHSAQFSSSSSNIIHNINPPSEVVPVHFPVGLPEIVLDYLGGYINIADSTAKAVQEFKFFGRNTQAILPPSDVSLAAKHILWGEADEAEALVIKKPSILNYVIEAQDPSGRRVEGMLLQLAAMAGDFNINKTEESKDNGMVERLAAAGNLTKEQVAEQLYPVLFSKEAISQNEARNKRAIDALEVFANELLEIKEAKDEKFMDFQKRCEPSITKFRNLLKPNSNEIITCGYLFDTQILYQAMQWFMNEINVERFGGWKTYHSNIFWLSGIGSLQRIVSTRDAHVINCLTESVTRHLEVPPRVLQNDDGSNYFFNSSTALGHDFFFSGWGLFGYISRLSCNFTVLYTEEFMLLKKSSIARLMQCPNSPTKKS